MATIEDNDPFYSAAHMLQSTSRADIIYNEYKARAYASTVAINEVDRNTPPVTGNEYEAYLIGQTPTDDWAGLGLEGQIAVWIGGWKYIPVKNGMRVQVLSGPPGQEGRFMDRHQGNWSSLGGVQTSAIIDKGGGLYQAEWELKYGDTTKVVLNQATIQLQAPAGIRYGRRFYVLAQQDDTGSRQIAFKDGDWMTSGGTTPQPTAASGSVTLYTFIHPGPSYFGPMLVDTVLNLQPA